MNFKQWINESMSVYIRDYEYPRVTDLSSLANEIHRKLWYEIPQYKQAKHRETLTIDGFEDYDKNSGTLNLYWDGIPKEVLPRVLAGIKYHLSDLKVKYAPFREETSNLYKTPVIRIPVSEIPSPKDVPPDLNMSNDNARLIFKDVLGFGNYESDSGFAIPVRELSMKLGMVKPTDISANVRPTTVEKGERGPTMISGGLSDTDIQIRLDRIKEITQWAMDNDYDYIDVV